VSVIVIPDFTAIGLVLEDRFLARYEATAVTNQGGSEGVAMPALPPAIFVPPLSDPLTGAFVLGGPLFLTRRGLGGPDAAALLLSQALESPDMEAPAEIERQVWDGTLSDQNVYFSGKSPSDYQISAITTRGGTCIMTGLMKSRPLTLLIVKETSDWRN
jgi:hypothetical protein